MTALDRCVQHPRDDWTVPTENIDNRKYPESPAVHEAIDHEVHAPPFVRARWRRCNDTKVTGELASPLRSKAQTETFLPVYPANPFTAHAKSLSLKHDHDAPMPKRGRDWAIARIACRNIRSSRFRDSQRQVDRLSPNNRHARRSTWCARRGKCPSSRPTLERWCRATRRAGSQRSDRHRRSALRAGCRDRRRRGDCAGRKHYQHHRDEQRRPEATRAMHRSVLQPLLSGRDVRASGASRGARRCPRDGEPLRIRSARGFAAHSGAHGDVQQSGFGHEHERGACDPTCAEHREPWNRGTPDHRARPDGHRLAVGRARRVCRRALRCRPTVDYWSFARQDHGGIVQSGTPLEEPLVVDDGALREPAAGERLCTKVLLGAGLQSSKRQARPSRTSPISCDLDSVWCNGSVGLTYAPLG